MKIQYHSCSTTPHTFIDLHPSWWCCRFAAWSVSSSFPGAGVPHGGLTTTRRYTAGTGGGGSNEESGESTTSHLNTQRGMIIHETLSIARVRDSWYKKKLKQKNNHSTCIYRVIHPVHNKPSSSVDCWRGRPATTVLWPAVMNQILLYCLWKWKITRRVT